jgi:hypothetical protein
MVLGAFKTASLVLDTSTVQYDNEAVKRKKLK